jgi:hypothetical protein
MAEDADRAAQQDTGGWMFLIEPSWRADGGEAPPPTAVVGGWFTHPDGTAGLFRANPGYVPIRPGLPTDPVDACLRSMAHGEADVAELLNAVCETMLEIAVDEEQNPVIVPAPDDVPSVMVVTAPPHRHRVSQVTWLDVSAQELADALPDEGVDVLINPGAPDSIRLLARALKRAVSFRRDLYRS